VTHSENGTGNRSEIRELSSTPKACLWNWDHLVQLLHRTIPPPRRHCWPVRLAQGGEDYTVSQLGESRIAGLRLDPSHNSTQVEFMAPDPQSGEDLRYKFQLTRRTQVVLERREHARKSGIRIST
jgi:hypothetical protein